MIDKDKYKKKNHSKNIPVIPIPHEVIAVLTNSSLSMVKKVRNGEKLSTGEKGRRIKLAESLLEKGSNALIEAVKKAIKY